MTTYPPYGPYGAASTLPEFLGGIDDDNSLSLVGIVESGNGWFPQILGGRYFVSGESDFRYLFQSPETITVPLNVGRYNFAKTLPTSLFSLESAGMAPITLVSSGTVFTPLVNSTAWCNPVPLTNVVSAGGYVSPSYLNDPGLSVLAPDTQFWWFPTNGARVLAVHRSRNPRSYDVLADHDSLLSRVTYPDELIDDRTYCHDEQAAMVFGRVPIENLPPAPYGSGKTPVTYVSIALPEQAIQNYDPLCCQEITYVDTDGYIRLRRAGVVGLSDFPASSFSPQVFYNAPDGPITCTVNSVIGNTINALVPDPNNGNALARLDYGATVLVKYWVLNSYCIAGASGGTTTPNGVLTLGVDCLSSITGVGTITYETETGKLACSATASSPNLNPLTNQVSSGFLYLEDSNNPVPVPTAVSAQIKLSTHTPVYDLDYSTGETLIVKVIAFDIAGIEISGAPLSLTISSGYTVQKMSPASSITAADASLLFYLIPTGSAASSVTLSIADTRAPAVPLASETIIPMQAGTAVPTWDPSVFVSLAENYRYVGPGTEAQTRRMVRAFAIQPDGFPWLSTLQCATDAILTVPCSLSITSDKSVFHDPSSGNDLSLGSFVQVSLGDNTNLLSPSKILSVGYTPVSGDILRAIFYVGDFRYESFPLIVS